MDASSHGCCSFYQMFTLLIAPPDDDTQPHHPERFQNERIFEPGKGSDSQEPASTGAEERNPQDGRNDSQVAPFVAQYRTDAQPPYTQKY